MADSPRGGRESRDSTAVGKSASQKYPSSQSSKHKSSLQTQWSDLVTCSRINFKLTSSPRLIFCTYLLNEDGRIRKNSLKNGISKPIISFDNTKVWFKTAQLESQRRQWLLQCYDTLLDIFRPCLDNWEDCHKCRNWGSSCAVIIKLVSYCLPMGKRIRSRNAIATTESVVQIANWSSEVTGCFWMFPGDELITKINQKS